MKTFNIAIIGCGGVAGMHLDGYLTHPDRVNVVAACDLDLSLARAACDRCSLPQAFASTAEMLSGADWRVAVVCKRHALAVMGVHWFDGFRWMLGSEADSVFCRSASSDAIDCLGETDASAQMHFDCGATVTFVESFSSPICRNETIVLGDRASLVVGEEQVALYDADSDGLPAEIWKNPFAGAGISQATFRSLDELLTAVENGGEPVNSGRDNLKTIALLDGAYRSAETGQIVIFREGLPK